MRNLLAQINLGPEGGFRGFGPLGLEGRDSFEAPLVFSDVISTTIGVITVVAIIWFLIQLFTGAAAIIGSGGDKAKVEQARSKITTGVIGLVVVIAGIFVADLIGSLIGFSILDFAGNFVKVTQELK